jgi:chloride channel protein, CIC family
LGQGKEKQTRAGRGIVEGQLESRDNRRWTSMKNELDSADREEPKGRTWLRSSGHALMMVVAALIGVGGGFGAVGFRYLIRLVQWAAFGSWDYSLKVASSTPWYILIFLPAAGLFVIFPLVNRFAREAKGHGVPEVMEAVAMRGGMIRARLVAVKTLASAICIGTGGSVGREGPIAQIGSAFGSTVGQLLRVPVTRLRTLVGCGAAAGIAGTFNAPIAGALFAVEVILGDFGVPQFSPIVISSVVSTVVSRRFLGNTPAFIVPTYQLVSVYELMPYAILGLIAAGVGVAFSTLLYKVEDLFEDLKVPGWSKSLIGGMIIGSIALGFPHILGVGYETIDMALAGEMGWHSLLALLFIKLAATSVTLGSGGSGGIFAPSLFLGAMTGGFWGHIVHSLWPSVTAGPGAYALVGMGAVVAAATHAPLTAMIIIFEMTGHYEIVPPLMAGCVIASILSTRLKKTSIYTEKLARRGVQLFEPLENNVLKKWTVSQVMTSDPVVIPEGATFQKVVELFVHSPRSEFFVVRNGKQYVGTISVHRMRQVLLDRDRLESLIIAGDMAESSYPILRERDNLDMVMKLFTQENVNELPVISENQLVGSVRKSDVLELYHQEIMKRDLPGSFRSVLASATRNQSIYLGDGYLMAEVEVPPYFLGKTVREMDVRNQYGVDVLLIHPAKKSGKYSPTLVPPDYRFSAGDAFLIAGKEDPVRRLAGY